MSPGFRARMPVHVFEGEGQSDIVRTPPGTREGQGFPDSGIPKSGPGQTSARPKAERPEGQTPAWPGPGRDLRAKMEKLGPARASSTQVPRKFPASSPQVPRKFRGKVRGPNSAGPAAASREGPRARCPPVHHGSGIGIGTEYRGLSGIGRIGRPSPSREPPGGRDARSGRRGSHRL